MNKEKKIRRIHLNGNEWIWSKPEKPIEVFFENGEMALVKWYRCGNQDFNGKYVSAVEYEESL